MSVTKIAMFDTKEYDISSFKKALDGDASGKNYAFTFIDDNLSIKNVSSVAGHKAVCVFVNDDLSAPVLEELKKQGVTLVLLRCAGFDGVDLEAARSLEISVARVPAYSPYAVAEFATTLLLTINRNTHIAYNRMAKGNCTLGGLTGLDLFGKTVGVVGTGKIGCCLINIMIGFGCKILAYDVYINKEYEAKPEVTYTTLDEIFKNSDFISLHAPLFKETEYMINEKSLALMKPDCIIVNTSRGKLINTKDLIAALEKKQIRGAGLDVYENEAKYFFRDNSGKPLEDPMLAKLVSLPNCLITSHQAFLTNEALTAISTVTLKNLKEFFEENKKLKELTNAC